MTDGGNRRTTNTTDIYFPAPPKYLSKNGKRERDPFFLFTLHIGLDGRFTRRSTHHNKPTLLEAGTRTLAYSSATSDPNTENGGAEAVH